MPKIETPEEFAQTVKDNAFDPWCWNSAEAQFTGDFDLEEAARLITAREAAIRAESAELLRVCGGALKTVPKIMESFEYTPDEDSCTGESIFKAKLNEDGFFIALGNAKAALAALKDAGVRV